VVIFQDISKIKNLERQKDLLLATVSHDLKNSVTAILGVGQLLLRRANQEESPGQARLIEGLETIIHAANSIAQQIKELLDTTRLQLARAPDLDARPVDLVPLLDRLVREYNHYGEEHRFVLRTAPGSLTCVCDPVRLERAITNVFSNALKYSTAGGDIAVTLALTDDTDNYRAVLSVSDQGIGIPSADLPRVFEPFYRASNVTGQIAGSGIGLAGVRQIIEQHGGAITIASEEGAGTTVTITLPCTRT
jgi:signal transduction histidine kinase